MGVRSLFVSAVCVRIIIIIIMGVVSLTRFANARQDEKDYVKKITVWERHAKTVKQVKKKK